MNVLILFNNVLLYSLRGRHYCKRLTEINLYNPISYKGGTICVPNLQIRKAKVKQCIPSHTTNQQQSQDMKPDKCSSVCAFTPFTIQRSFSYIPIFKRPVQGCLAGSVSRACDSRFQGLEFKPYIGQGFHFFKKNKQKILKILRK